MRTPAPKAITSATGRGGMRAKNPAAAPRSSAEPARAPQRPAPVQPLLRKSCIGTTATDDRSTRGRDVLETTGALLLVTDDEGRAGDRSTQRHEQRHDQPDDALARGLERLQGQLPRAVPRGARAAH